MQTLHKEVRINLDSQDQIVIACELCAYKCRLNVQLKKHKKTMHPKTSQPKQTWSCETCGFASEFILDMWKHREEQHSNSTPEFQPKPKQDFAIAFLAEHNLDIMEEMDTLKKEVRASILRLASDIEDNLATIRDESKACSKITLDAISQVYNKIGSFQSDTLARSASTPAAEGPGR